ncbi:hypothetical protein HX773_11965 [Pantoea sp. B9002]|uniref:hypothetical protein n=1 Tax=Pantoea sp. B9002 TaxID=2726979 RepID=UPI0015A39D9A|nr:hypothetical protein [Pantoea sp. B9002]NWA61601.1 hypothetical protein [Pantoea sp. B9002]
MKYKVLLVLAILLLCACDDEEPDIKVETFNKVNQYINLPYVSVSVSSLVDDIEIQDIIVNRDSCKIENQRFKGLNNGMKKIPKHIHYGEVVTVDFSGPCNASQVDVVTNKGSWSWKYE